MTLFAAYYANVTLFEHCHIVNGVTICHSHVHPESHHSTPTGGHSSSSLTLIAALGQIEALSAGSVLCGLAVYAVLCGRVAEPKAVGIVPICFFVRSLRAPPVLQ